MTTDQTRDIDAAMEAYAEWLKADAVRRIWAVVANIEQHVGAKVDHAFVEPIIADMLQSIQATFDQMKRGHLQ
jgi:hypothetical protein